MKKEPKKDGWQVDIEYFEDYVIKTPKTGEEIRKRIARHYKDKEDLERKVKKLQEDWRSSISIIKSGKIPLKLLAYPEFLKGGKIRQKRVKMLSDEFNTLIQEKKLNEAKKLVDKVIDFIITLWSYGIHEITFKFYDQFGLLDNDLVLVDLGELTNDKENVRKDLLREGKKLEDLRQHHHSEVLDYYQEQIKKRLTVNTLDKYWGSAIT